MPDAPWHRDVSLEQVAEELCTELPTLVQKGGLSLEELDEIEGALDQPMPNELRRLYQLVKPTTGYTLEGSTAQLPDLGRWHRVSSVCIPVGSSRYLLGG